MKSRWNRSMLNLEPMGQMRKSYKMLTVNPVGKRKLGRWQSTVAVNLKEQNVSE
jgi:hypothetical protein